MRYEEYNLFTYINNNLAVDFYLFFEYKNYKDPFEKYEFCKFITKSDYEFIIYSYDYGNCCSLTICKNDKLLLVQQNINLSRLDFIITNFS